MKVLFLLLILVWKASSDLPTATTFFKNFLAIEKELQNQWETQYSAFTEIVASNSASWAAAVQKLTECFADQAELAETGIQRIVAAKARQDTEKFQKQQEFFDFLKESILNLNQTDYIAKKIAERKEIQDKMTDLWGQWWEAYQQKRQKDLENYQASLEKIRQKWTEWQKKWNEAVMNHWEKQKEKYDEAKKEFEELKTMANNELMKREEAKKDRKEQRKQKLTESKDQIEAKKVELESLQQDFFQHMGVVLEKKHAVISLIDQLLSEEASFYWENRVRDKNQGHLDKIAYQKAVWDTLTGHNMVEPVAKATMLDQITGASGWRTATWVLLSISIVISFALLGLIFYTIQQHKNYERLDHVVVAPQQGVFFDHLKTAPGAVGYASTSASAPVALY